jgi:RNA polymerase sigma factor (sigma-70 family)
LGTPFDAARRKAVITTTAAAPPRGDRSRAAAWTDAELVQACIGGSQAVWDEMVERYGRLVFSIPRREGMGEADAEDVYQQVFAIMHRKLDGLRDASRLSAWLITTTLRECRRMRRRASRCEPLGDCAGNEGPPPEEIAALERQQLVRQALRRLGGTGERLLIALFFGQGRPSYQQIARELGIPTGSIGPTRARCFRKLEKILVEMGVDGADLARAAPAAGLLRIAG